MTHKPSPAQPSSGLDLAQWSISRVSSRYSWKATTALGCGSRRGHCGQGGLGEQSHHQTYHRGAPPAPGTLLQGACVPSPSRAPHPPARQDAQCSPRPATALTDRQTDRHPAAFQARRENLNKAAFPNRKNTVGKEKQKTETTRKTPLSLSHGADAMKSPAPRDGKHFASSPLPAPSGMGVLVVAVPLPVAQPRSPSPRHSPEPAGTRHSPIHRGVAQTSLFPRY